MLKQLIVFFHRIYASDLENPKHEVCSSVLTVPIISIIYLVLQFELSLKRKAVA